MKTNKSTRHAIVAMLAGLSIGAGAMGQSAQGFKLTGVVRDFSMSHSDFNLAPGSVGVSVAGLVKASLGAQGRPEFTGSGRVRSSSAIDASGRPLMSLDVVGAGGVVTDFSISEGQVVPNQTFAVELKLIGAAIQNSSYHLPVTARIAIGSDVFEPFGTYASPVNGNVNDNQRVTGSKNPGANPRVYRASKTYPAGTAITVTGRSWLRRSGTSGLLDSHWSSYNTVASTSGSTRLRVLRDGDGVPNYDPMYSQQSIAQYLSAYIDSAGKIDLQAHQAIYLFELGNGGDFQDLVVLASLVPNPQAFEPAVAPPCVRPGGTVAMNGSASNAGISSSASFDQWFADVPGTNLSAVHTIEFVPVGNGIFEHRSDDFAPIDRKLFGNQSTSRNRNFTYTIQASFDSVACGGQFFEFSGMGDAWAYVDGTMVMDLGGMRNGARQVIDMDRLGLDPSRPHVIQFFYAQRADVVTPFVIRTNIGLRGQKGASLPSTAVQFD